uniref:NADH dehydrogenase subunit 6 n=1 Tax=Rexea prometheoides TaxID=887134 RepID=UPI002201A5BF|nr:NADH dehydrogenase subunit 6 [Rexea prometheoides]UXX50417.1 NADH dehydrogenase subunit 6 [Rexea prometheoides]
MSYLMCHFLYGFVSGLVAVAANPSPYFAAMGLVVVAGMGCAVLCNYGGSFLSLVLFLIYLGGMLVVFAYTAALAADRDPKTWGELGVAVYVLFYTSLIALCCWIASGDWFETSWVPCDDMNDFTLFRGDMSGVATMYSSAGGMLLISAWVLLLTLLVVLELTRGLSRGAVRAV